MSSALNEAMEVIRRFAPNFQGKVGIILGSGLSEFTDQISNPVTIPYQAIPGLKASSIAGHASLLILGYLNDTPVVCLKGRLHIYEGATYEEIQLLVRIVKQLGCHTLVVTGAAGSLRPEVGPGELMVINDHLNFQPGNPLVGPNDETVGPRFVSLENAYDKSLREILTQSAARLKIRLSEGVYISLLGPSFETPAEIRAYRLLGADAVGMSVVPEVILARHCGLKVVGIAAITNLAVGLSKEKVTHEVTLHYAQIVARNLTKLLTDFVKDESLEMV